MLHWLLSFFRPVWKRYPNPPVTFTASPATTARAYAATLPGAFVNVVSPTGSMRPTLMDHDYVVLSPAPFDTLKLGDIVTYKAGWKPSLASVIHRLVAKDRGGFIASGDNNPRSEPEWRITPASYYAKCVAVFRAPGHP